MILRMAAIVIALAASIACQQAEQCASFSSSAAGASWSGCGDKKARKVDCELTTSINAGAGTPKPVKCTCSVDGVVGKTFEMTDSINLGTLESATSIANEQCGWKISR
jgi:hypothetical protein